MAFLENIGAELKKIPPWGYALGGVALFVGYQFWQSQQNASGNTASADTTGITGQTATGIDTGFNSADFAGSDGSIGGTSGSSGGVAGTTSTSTGTADSSTTPTATVTAAPAPAAPAAAPAPAPAPAAKPAAAPAPLRYTVKSGDTLADIAYYFRTSRGQNVSWQQIYSTNESTIENTARNHGFSSSDDGHWIFPGEVLTIP